MSTHNPYAWMNGLIAAQLQAEQASAKKPSLTLITTEKPNCRKDAKVRKTAETEALKKELAATLNDAAAPPRNKTAGHRKHLSDEARMVHNALNAVRCLAIPSGRGDLEDLANVGRNQFVDLLEIINDRLGAALEMDEAGH